jgi:hypothetical protein
MIRDMSFRPTFTTRIFLAVLSLAVLFANTASAQMQLSMLLHGQAGSSSGHVAPASSEAGDVDCCPDQGAPCGDCSLCHGFCPVAPELALVTSVERPACPLFRAAFNLSVDAHPEQRPPIA